MKQRESKQVLYGATNKRRKRSQLQLCNLPMNILCSILSRLPLNDAVRTSILSSQWRYVWCDHTNQLTFNSYTFRRCSERTSNGCYKIINANEFTARVDAVLQQHSGVGVERMKVKYPLHNKHAVHLDRWVEFAIASRTKELALFLSDKPMMLRDVPYRFLRANELYSFPCQLLDGSCLQFLQLVSVSLKPPPPPSNADFGSDFRNLKRLILVDVDITDEDVESFLSHCKVVESLVIAFCGMLTAIRAPCPLKQLKHLRVECCGFLEKVEMMNCSCLAALEYIGPMVSLVFAEASSLTNVWIEFMTFDTALDYIITGFPSTLPHLEMLHLHCIEQERAASPLRLLKFTHLRHLRLELIVFGPDGRKTDVLDYVHLLQVSPFLEILELHMWMNCPHQPYDVERDGELRSHCRGRLPTHQQHGHLKWVHITGFFGHKDQVELALHILTSSAVLRIMKIDPRVRIIADSAQVPVSDYRARHYVDGRRIAAEFVRDAGHGDVVRVVGASKMAPKAQYLGILFRRISRIELSCFRHAGLRILSFLVVYSVGNIWLGILML